MSVVFRISKARDWGVEYFRISKAVGWGDGRSFDEDIVWNKPFQNP